MILEPCLDPRTCDTSVSITPLPPCTPQTQNRHGKSCKHNIPNKTCIYFHKIARALASMNIQQNLPFPSTNNSSHNNIIMSQNQSFIKTTINSDYKPTSNNWKRNVSLQTKPNTKVSLNYQILNQMVVLHQSIIKIL